MHCPAFISMLRSNINCFLLSLFLLLAGVARSTSLLDEGLVIWRLESWRPAVRVTGQLTIILPANTADVNLSACFTSVTRDAASTLVISARVNHSCLDDESVRLTINTTLRGPEFYGGYAREAIIYPTRGVSHQFTLSPMRIEGLGLEYDPARYWDAHDSRLSDRLDAFRAAHITARWVGQPLVQRQMALPVNVTFVCLLPPGSGSIWNFTSLDAGAAHTLLIGSRLYTLGAGATIQALVNTQPPFALSTSLAQWVGDLRDSEGFAMRQAPTILVPPRQILSQSTLPSCYCGYNVACTLTAESTRHRRVEHVSALHLDTLVNGASVASVATLQISESIALFNDSNANIFRWVMISFSVFFLFWALWTCLSSPPSTLVPPTLDGLQFTSEISQPYRRHGNIAAGAIPVPPSAADREGDND